MTTISSFDIGLNNSMKGVSALQGGTLVNPQNYQILGFIRGLSINNTDSNQSSLLISIVNTSLTSNSIMFQLSTNFTSDKIQLSSCSISYLIFLPSNIGFASFGGLISKSNIVGKSQNDIMHLNLPTTYYTFYGLTSLNSNNKALMLNTSITFDLTF
jgi:hypothetical protein